MAGASGNILPSSAEIHSFLADHLSNLVSDSDYDLCLAHTRETLSAGWLVLVLGNPGACPGNCASGRHGHGRSLRVHSVDGDFPHGSLAARRLDGKSDSC